MKFRIFALVLCLAVMLACFSVPVSGAQSAEVQPQEQSAVKEQVLAARFLNMLSHNNNYNDDFSSVDTMVNNSVLSLLELRDSQNEDFIKAEYVIDFVSDMYGIEVVDVSELNAEWPQLDGYIYIIPKGFTAYTHEIESISLNEDGSYTVYTTVSVDCHDDEPQEMRAVSLFVSNTSSAFGYSMIYCDIIEDSTTI